MIPQICSLMALATPDACAGGLFLLLVDSEQEQGNECSQSDVEFKPEKTPNGASSVFLNRGYLRC